MEPKPYHSVRELEMDRISKDRHLQQFFGKRDKLQRQQRKDRTWTTASSAAPVAAEAQKTVDKPKGNITP